VRAADEDTSLLVNVPIGKSTIGDPREGALAPRSMPERLIDDRLASHVDIMNPSP
jgi:hypothetical protein